MYGNVEPNYALIISKWLEYCSLNVSREAIDWIQLLSRYISASLISCGHQCFDESNALSYHHFNTLSDNISILLDNNFIAFVSIVAIDGHNQQQS